MPKCLRTGCPNEKQNPDPTGLGLCPHHNHQFHQHTIGKNHNPRKREYPTHQARHILTQITNPTDTITNLVHRIGISKDTIHDIKHGHTQTVSSQTWENLLDTLAQQQYERKHHAKKH